MITKKLCSPFLFAMLCFAVVVVGCGKNKSDNFHQKQMASIDRQLKAVSQQKTPAKTRRDSATAAYENALRLDSAIVVWKAFTAKYALLQAEFPDEAAAFLQIYTNRAKQHNDSLNLSNAWFEKGKLFRADDRPDSAYYYYNASRLISEARKDSTATAEKLMNIADLHYTYNDFAEFETVTTEALKFMPGTPKTATDSIFRMIAYNNYGLAYMNLFEYNNALSYYKKALRLNTNKLYANTILNNMAFVYMQDGDYKKSIGILAELPELEIVKTDPLLQARILDNLGYSQWKSQLQDGILNLHLALNIREQQNDDFGSIASGVHLANYYQMPNPQKAFNYANAAYQKATVLNSTNDRLTALKLLAHLPSPNSRKFSDRYMAIKDSIDEVRQKAKNQFAKIKYDSKTANEENSRLRTQTQLRTLQFERSLWMNITLGVAVVVILTISRLLFLLYRKRHKKEKIMETYHTEQRISKKVHDELANDVFNTIAFTQTQDLSNHSKKETLLANLDSIYDRARDISRANSPVDTGANFPLQLRQLFAEYQSPEIKIMIRGLDAMPWETMEADKKLTVYRVLQELLVNMKKHSQAKNVVIQFSMEEKKAKITYSDNGVGMQASEILFKNGLQNTENRIHAIGGHIIFESEPGKGLQATITYPPENNSYV